MNPDKITLEMEMVYDVDQFFLFDGSGGFQFCQYVIMAKRPLRKKTLISRDFAKRKNLIR
jgi:hypothetical protein